MGQVFYIDLTGISSKEELQALLTKELPLPDYYGSNLDALYDVLTEQGEGWNLIFYNVTKITVDMENYLTKLQKMCKNAANECDNLQIRFFP
ncbi:barstar family protein [Butyrivibrio sp. CB08]|uniref:barstar family protein n=1 Tax=Butyrivibrio sp. CB08 TaxID=2364879 RepID=UPI001313E09A|nr:barstar family protein [Butyrivibrio sp. CB08]